MPRGLGRALRKVDLFDVVYIHLDLEAAARLAATCVELHGQVLAKLSVTGVEPWLKLLQSHQGWRRLAFDLSKWLPPPNWQTVRSLIHEARSRRRLACLINVLCRPHHRTLSSPAVRFVFTGVKRQVLHRALEEVQPPRMERFESTTSGFQIQTLLRLVGVAAALEEELLFTLGPKVLESACLALEFQGPAPITKRAARAARRENRGRSADNPIVFCS